jgi:hypothetical protein
MRTKGRATKKFAKAMRKKVPSDSPFMKMLQNISPFNGSPLYDPLAKKNRTLKQRKADAKKGSQL